MWWPFHSISLEPLIVALPDHDSCKKCHLLTSLKAWYAVIMNKTSSGCSYLFQVSKMLRPEWFLSDFLQKNDLNIRQIIRCQLTRGVVSGITAYLSSVSPRPDVQSYWWQSLSLSSLARSFSLFAVSPHALPKVHSEACRLAPTRVHTRINACSYSMDGRRLTVSWQAAGDSGMASCCCPTSAQLSEPRAAFEQPITPTQHQGKAISSRGAALSHQMAWEMNRAIILARDNSSDGAN